MYKKMTNRGEVLGEVDPGFNLWTSAHGFHHLSLSNRKVWKILWALVLILVIGGLIAVLVYYFVHVFTFAKYSVVTLESPGTYSFHNEFSCPTIFNLLEYPSNPQSILVNY